MTGCSGTKAILEKKKITTKSGLPKVFGYMMLGVGGKR